MRLVSTFRDYYDHMFDGEGETFIRTGGNVGPPKREQFRILEAAGFKTPPHGPVCEVAGSWWEDEKQWVKYVVAYEDENAHCTEGKRVIGPMQYKWDGCLSRLQEFRRVSELYCSAFVCHHYPTFGVDRPSVSWRLLQVGHHRFWVEYRSTESWMSNLGDGTTEVIGVEKDVGYHHSLRYPLFAVDFVLGRGMYAVDFNTAPGIRGSGVEKHLPAAEAVRAIEAWFQHEGHGPGRTVVQPGPDRANATKE